MSSLGERLVLAVALGAALAVCGYYCSRMLAPRRLRRPRSRVARLVATARCVSLRELQRLGPCVALCGTVFDISGDFFFDADRAGIYSSWVGHDVTFLLLQLGLTPEAADDAAAVRSYLEQECSLGALHKDEKAERRRELLKEWYTRFHGRYEVLAQLRDRYVGEPWDEIRDELLPEDGDGSAGKCPLGFGAKTVTTVVSRKETDVEKMQTIVFQGRRYDVTDSSLFQEDGQFAHLVGHDVTYALAVQSTRLEDLDVTPTRAYTFEEQLLLEKYRNFFATELVLVEVDGGQTQPERNENKAVVSIHTIIEHSDGVTKEESAQHLEKALENASAEQIDELCVRTMMTPLHKAVEKHRLDLVTLLVHAGADVTARAALYDDKTPLEMAQRFHFDDIVAHLESGAISSD